MVFLEFELEICGLYLSNLKLRKIEKSGLLYFDFVLIHIILGQSQQPEDNELAASESNIKALYSSNYLHTILNFYVTWKKIEDARDC